MADTSPDEVIRIIPVMVMSAGVVTALLVRPLMQGKVPPNLFYGIRTKLAFSSEENWYRVNKLGGRIFFKASVMIAVIGLVGLFMPDAWLIVYAVLAAILSLVLLIGAGIGVLSIL